MSRYDTCGLLSCILKRFREFWKNRRCSTFLKSHWRSPLLHDQSHVPQRFEEFGRMVTDWLFRVRLAHPIKFFCSSLLLSVTVSTHAYDFESLFKPENLSQSWAKAVVYVPDSFFPKDIDFFLSKPKSHNVMIYLHGCSGITDDTREWGRILKSLGFLVIIPDSFAIPGRKSNCDPSNYKRGQIKGFNAFELRDYELMQVMTELQKLQWIDMSKVFLMGHSEGGMAVSLTAVKGFKAVVATGYWCRDTLNLKHGYSPFLFVNWERDPWYSEGSRQQSFKYCEEVSKSRSNTRQVLLQGEGHSTSKSSQARKAVEDFLRPFLD